MKRAVVDASVVLKWYLDDEVQGVAALQIAHRYAGGEIELIAPSLLEYEVLNGLIVAQRRGRVDARVIDIAIEGFMNLGVPVREISPLSDRVVRYCRRYGISAYDAAYLAVADREKALFITADESLHVRVRKDLNWVVLLSEVTW